MRTKHLAILEHRERPIVLSQPVVEAFSLVEGLESHNELLFEFDVLGYGRHSLLSGVPPEIVDDLQVLFLIHGFLDFCLLLVGVLL